MLKMRYDRKRLNLFDSKLVILQWTEVNSRKLSELADFSTNLSFCKQVSWTTQLDATGEVAGPEQRRENFATQIWKTTRHTNRA